jgi:hypothetical protein
MLRPESSSYYGTYIRNKAQKPSDHEMQRLMTDRAAYLSYLEVQLERVSAACLVSQGFSERIEQQQSQIHAVEEKIVNLAKMIRLTKAFNDEEGKASESSVAHLGDRMQRLEADVAKFVLNPDNVGAGGAGFGQGFRGGQNALLASAASSVGGLTGASPLQVLHDAAKVAASEALERLPVLEQMAQLSRKYSDHSLNIATIATDKIKLQDRVADAEQRLAHVSSLLSDSQTAAQRAEEARGLRLEDRLAAFEAVLDRKVEASMNTLRLELEKKMNNRWEYMEGKVAALESRIGVVESNSAEEVAELQRTVAKTKEEVRLFSPCGDWAS